MREWAPRDSSSPSLTTKARSPKSRPVKAVSMGKVLALPTSVMPGYLSVKVEILPAWSGSMWWITR